METQSRALGYRPALDGLRGLAVTAVLLVHSDLGIGEGGGIGVHVFFVLSGFLITTLLLQEWSEHGRVRLGYFWARRALRLLPALIVVVMAVIIYSATLAPPEVAATANRAVPAVLLYASNWVQALGHTDLGMLGHTWSLSVEEQFYLVWPLLLIAILARRGRAAAPSLVALALAVGAGALVLRIVTWRGLEGAARLFGTDMVADQLLGGALLAVILFFGSDTARARLARACRWAWIPAALYLLHVVFSFRLVSGTWAAGTYATVGLTLAAVSSIALITTVVTRPGSGPDRVLSWRPLVALGRISYGVYLWQLPVFYVVVIHMGSANVWARAAVGMASSVLLATLSWLLVERWALALKPRFRDGEPAAEPALVLVPQPAAGR